MIGKEPIMSITENRIIVTDKIAVIAIAHKLNYTNINGIVVIFVAYDMILCHIDFY